MAKTTSSALKIATFIVVAPIVVGLGVCAYDGAAELAALSQLSIEQVKLCALAAIVLYTIAIAAAGLKLAASMQLKNFFGTLGCMIYCKRAVTESLYSAEERKNARNMVRILITFMLVIPFWSLFDQTGSSWLTQGENMKDLSFNFFGITYRFGEEEMQCLNPLFVMVLIPLLTIKVYPYVKKLANPMVRMGLGIVLAGLAYGLVCILQIFIDQKVELSILWQGIPYLVLTVAEILVSTTGLEYAYTAAGEKLKSTVSSFWSLTIALGNVLVICITSVIGGASVLAFSIYGILSVLVGLLFMYVTSRPAMKPEV